jgi:DnaJ-class molecular chaperone
MDTPKDCPYCHGQGRVSLNNNSGHIWTHLKCYFCDGTGKKSEKAESQPKPKED